MKEKIIRCAEYTLGQSRMANVKPTKPNHFISIPITNDEVVAKIAAMQNAVTGRKLDPAWEGHTDTSIFTESLVPIPKLHVTINVMNLEGDTEVERANAVMEKVGSLFHEEIMKNPINIEVEGLDTFGTKVIVARIKDQETVDRLTMIHDSLQTKFNEQLGLPIDPKPFSPHVTIADINRSKTRKAKKLKSFAPDMWRDYEDTHFGAQKVSCLQLLKMGGGDPITGAYVSRGQYDFA